MGAKFPRLDGNGGGKVSGAAIIILALRSTTRTDCLPIDVFGVVL